MRPLNPAFKKCVVHVTKLVDIQGKFGALCRVYSGELKVGEFIRNNLKKSVSALS